MPCQSLFFNFINFTFFNFIKKETLAQVISREFSEIFSNTFFTEHLRVTASVFLVNRIAVAWNLYSLIAFLNRSETLSDL